MQGDHDVLWVAVVSKEACDRAAIAGSQSREFQCGDGSLACLNLSNRASRHANNIRNRLLAETPSHPCIAQSAGEIDQIHGRHPFAKEI